MGQDNGMSGFDFSTFSADDQSHTAGMDRAALFFYKPTYGDVETQYGKVINLCTALESEGSLSLNLALECDQVCGTQLSKLYFSDVPKQKKYVLAMEEIDGRALAIGTALAVGLAAFIALIVRHFTGKAVKGEVAKQMNSKAMQDVAAYMSKVQHEELTGAARDETNKAMENAGKSNVAQERLETNHNAHPGYVRPLKPVQGDILATGDYAKVMLDLLGTANDIQPLVTLKTAGHVYHELNTATSPMTEDHYKTHYYQLMAEPRKAHAELMKQINTVMAKETSLNSGTAVFPKDINSALRNFTHALTAPALHAYVQERDTLVPELERLRAQAQAASKTGTAITTGQVNSAREVMKEVHGLLAVILKTDIMFQKYWNDITGIAHYLYAAVSNAKYQLTRRLRDNKGLDPKRIALDPGILQLERLQVILDGFMNRVGA